MNNTATTLSSISSEYRRNQCEYYQYDTPALILWIIATSFCLIAFLSTIYTVFTAYQLWSTIQDLENGIIDLIDEACQILLPIGICKQICHPHHIGTVNANYATKGQKQDGKPGTRDNRYPEDVTFPPSDIEKVYDVMGDDDARKSKTLTLVSLDGSILDDKAKKSEPDKKPASSIPTTPTDKKQPSRDTLATPKHSLKTAKNTPVDNEKKPPANELATAKGVLLANKASTKSVKPSKKHASREIVGGPSVIDKKTPTKEKEGSKRIIKSKDGSKEDCRDGSKGNNKDDCKDGSKLGNKDDCKDGSKEEGKDGSKGNNKDDCKDGSRLGNKDDCKDGSMFGNKDDCKDGKKIGNKEDGSKFGKKDDGSKFGKKDDHKDSKKPGNKDDGSKFGNKDEFKDGSKKNGPKAGAADVI